MRKGQTLWSVDYMGLSLTGKVLGLIGMGNIARETAKKFIGAFNMQVVVLSPTSEPTRWTEADQSNGVLAHRRVDSLEELLKVADVVSLHAPLTPHTRNMIAEPQLKLMKKSAVLINLARGPLGVQCRSVSDCFWLNQWPRSSR